MRAAHALAEKESSWIISKAKGPLHRTERVGRVTLSPKAKPSTPHT